ncbi:uncharacterized protein G2W53_027423 [Senna tora]|uniref:Retrotransposon Copia-like N-terminal domain-containing protein n=1 Tax=Senna tora TaxID=362788 RepID=A0A834TGU0_9FABA|nr:uncharacterized protein G2W53_027423 [Senna tora]
MASYSGAVSGSKGDSKSDAVPWSLSNSDQPSMILVTSPLVGSNFVSWSLSIKTAIEAKEKLGFIDGTIKEPADESEHKKWKPVDSMVKAWVRNSIEQNLAETFMFYRTSRELWLQIEERYGVRSGPKFYQLQQELASLKQGSDSVTAYYNKIHRYWDELYRLRPTSRCYCGKCTCEFNKKLNNLEADTRLVQFLMGLNQPFEVIRSQILSLDPLPSVNKAFGLVVNVETEKEINSSQGSNLIEGSAMLAKGNTRNEFFKRSEDRKNEKKWQSKTSKNEYIPFTDTHWIVDTGASSHMCCNRELLINIRTLEKTVPVHLPDGSVQNVKHTGSVMIHGKLQLHNDQKTKQILVEGKLTDNLYILKHDLVNVCNIVECLESVNSIKSVNNDQDRNKNVHFSNSLLWHQRLGHIPIDVLKHVDGINVKSDSVLPKAYKSEQKTGNMKSLEAYIHNYAVGEESVLLQGNHNQAEIEEGVHEELEEQDIAEREDVLDEIQDEESSEDTYEVQEGLQENWMEVYCGVTSDEADLDVCCISALATTKWWDTREYFFG